MDIKELASFAVCLLASVPSFVFGADLPNDDFSGRATLVGASAVADAPFGAASRETGEPLHGALAASHSLWWTWTAPFHGELSLQGQGGVAAPIIAVYRGNALASLSLVANNNPWSGFVPDGELLVEVSAGEVIQIAVDTPDLFPIPETGQLRLRLTPPPTNDLFSGRLPIGEIPAVLSGVSKVATVEAAEPVPFPAAGNRSLWWSWTPSVAQRLVLTNHSGTWVNASVYTGETLSTLQQIAAGQLFNPLANSNGGTLAFDAVPGSEYLLRFDPVDASAVREIRVSLTEIVPPANDRFAHRSSLQGTNVLISSDIVAALSEPGEPRHFPDALGKSLWWSWTAPATGRLTLERVGNHSVFLTVYRGSTLTNLVSIAPEISPSHFVYCDVMEGETYQIVADAGRFPGAFQYQLNFERRSANDDFAARKLITGRSIVESFRTAATGREPLEPRVLKSSPGNSLWWSWLADSDGLLVIDAPAVVGVFTGENLSRLRKVMVDSGRVSSMVRSGVVYQIVIDAPETLGTREWSLNLYPTPANDSHVQPAAFSGTDVSFHGDTRGAIKTAGEPKIHPRSSGMAVWYSWTAPADGIALLSILNCEFLPVLGVYRKELSGRLTRLDSTSGNSEPPYGGITFPAFGGITYVFGIDSVPHEDTAIVGGFDLRLLFSTLRLTSPSNGAVVHDSDAVQFSISSPLDGVDGNLARVDFVRLYPDGGWITLASVSNAPFSAMVTGLPKGTGFFAALAETTEGQQRFTPANSVTVRPGNDDFANRQLMTGYGWEVQSRTDAATVERGEPSAGGGASLWYSWTAPANGIVTLAFGTARSTQRLTVHTGEALRSLRGVKLKSIDYYRKEFIATEGVTYHFAVRDSSAVPRDPDQSLSFGLQLDLKSLRLLQPVDGMVFEGGRDILLSCRVLDTPTSVVRVEYFSGTNLIAVSTAAPYSAIWTNPPGGEHNLSARVVKAGEASPKSASVHVVVRPGNDQFADAFLIAGRDANMRQSTRSGTREAGEPLHANRSLPQTSWWKWTAPADGAALVKLVISAGSSNAPAFAAYTGTSFDSLVVVTQRDFGMPLVPTVDRSGEVMFTVVAGETYSFAFAEQSGSDLEFAFSFRERPPNDSFAERVAIVGDDVRLSGWTAFAEQQPDWEKKGVWWTWRAPSNGLVKMTATIVRGTLSMEVFTGESISHFQHVNQLTPPLLISAAGFRTIPPRQPPVPTLTTLAAFYARAGVDYHLVLTDSIGGSFGFDLDFSFRPAPSNDDFASPISLTGERASLIVNNSFAGTEPAEPNWFPYSVWFSWVAPASGVLNLTSAATNPVPMFAVYKGDNLDQLVAVSPNSLGSAYSVNAGQLYRIAVGSTADAFGTFPVELELIPAAALSTGLISATTTPQSLLGLTPGKVPVRIEFKGEVGGVYRIEASTNLSDWSVIATNQLLDPVGVISDPVAQGWPARFYRVTRLR